MLRRYADCKDHNQLMIYTASNDRLPLKFQVRLEIMNYTKKSLPNFTLYTVLYTVNFTLYTLYIQFVLYNLKIVILEIFKMLILLF